MTASCLLFIQARRLDRLANSSHAHAIADGLISSPYLDDPLKHGRVRWVMKVAPEAETSPTEADDVDKPNA